MSVYISIFQCLSHCIFQFLSVFLSVHISTCQCLSYCLCLSVFLIYKSTSLYTFSAQQTQMKKCKNYSQQIILRSNDPHLIDHHFSSWWVLTSSPSSSRPSSSSSATSGSKFRKRRTRPSTRSPHSSDKRTKSWNNSL